MRPRHGHGQAWTCVLAWPCARVRAGVRAFVCVMRVSMCVVLSRWLWCLQNRHTFWFSLTLNERWPHWPYVSGSAPAHQGRVSLAGTPRELCSGRLTLTPTS